jgi:flagellar assembly protein FliH
MAAIAKFMFDTDFAAPDGGRPRGASDAEVAQRVAEAEARGYQRGLAAGRQEAEATTARRAMAALEAIAASLGVVAGGVDAITGRIETEGVEVALAAARKLAATLVAAEPLAETQALLDDCFRHLVAVPHLAVRINAALYDSAQPQIERLAAQRGFAGRLIILADPDIELGDCAIEWADGGVTRTRAEIDARVTELVTRYLAARGEGASTLSDEGRLP